MHRLPSQASIRRIRLVSILVIFKFIAIPVLGLLMAAGILLERRDIVATTLILFGVVLLLAIVEWTLSARTNCPLCITPVLGKRKCRRHRRAKTLFGSYRLRVALSVIFKNSFRCPYCNEPTLLEVRSSSRRYSRD